MPRFYISPDRWNPEALSLEDAEAKHATQVLRLGVGDRVTVFNGEGTRAVCEIASAEKRLVTLRPLEVTATPGRAARLGLAVGVPKGKTLEWILEKAVELGASDVFPLLTERTVVRIPPDERAERREKWQREVVEACKQCGQDWMPRVHEPAALEAVDFSRFATRIIGSLEPGARPLGEVASGAGGAAVFLVGPEGDFTTGEYAWAREHGFQPVNMGPLILRTETAALAGLAVLALGGGGAG